MLAKLFVPLHFTALRRHGYVEQKHNLNICNLYHSLPRLLSMSCSELTYDYILPYAFLQIDYALLVANFYFSPYWWQAEAMFLSSHSSVCLSQRAMALSLYWGNRKTCRSLRRIGIGIEFRLFHLIFFLSFSSKSFSFHYSINSYGQLFLYQNPVGI